MTEKAWKIGKDLFPEDNILDPITFDELIMTVRCNCPHITAEAMMEEFRNILTMRLEDARCLINNNMEEVVDLAKKERGQ